MAQLIADASPHTPRKPAHDTEIIILTSGSSGTPRGAARAGSTSRMMSTFAGFLQKVPLTRGDVIYLAPPAFHGWGLICTLSGLLLGATLVFDGRFRAERAVVSMHAHGATVLVAVPTMLRRLTALPDDQLTPLAGWLRIIGSGGARLAPELVVDVQNRFGRVLHNLYGATEVSYITIATPEDLADDPTCAGSAPLGVTVAIITDGRPAAPGEVGEICVRTGAQMKSYTDGSTKESVNGLVRTGDTGYLDERGRLFIRGRADGMIVSGGENVFPEDVELTLARHPKVNDAVVFTVADKDFGERISAVVAVDDESLVSTADLKDFVATELSRSCVPRDIHLVPDIPRTATGKVTRAVLQVMLEEFPGAP